MSTKVQRPAETPNAKSPRASHDSRTETSSQVSTLSEEKTLDPPERQWRFTQWFQKSPVEDSQPESSLLSAVEFDRTGDFLATGDRGGRVVVLRCDDAKTSGKLHYKFHCEFQSHECEFDYVKSASIEEKINKIKWLPATNDSQFMLTTNDRVVKLWKLAEKEIKMASGFNLVNDKGHMTKSKKVKTLKLPKMETMETLVTATTKRIFSGEIHKFNIHSLNCSSDGETFISADNLCINQWSLYRDDVAYNIVNIKPEDINQLTEVITSVDLEQEKSNMFMYATNRGVVRLGDMREKALNDLPGKVFSDPQLEQMDKKQSASGPNSNRPFLSDMLRSISDVKFAMGGTQIVARDYMSVKIWDVRTEKRPVHTIQVHDYLSPKLWDLYENECIFDCFDVSVSSQGEVLAGSYGNYFHVYDINSQTDTMIEASKPPVTVPLATGGGDPASRDSQKNSQKKKRLSRPGLGSFFPGGRKKKSGTKEKGALDIDPNSLSYSKRVMQLGFHPDCNAVAVAGENNLFIYAR